MARQLSPTSEIALNPEQLRAVEHGAGPLLVVAGAGTGKTRVITERIRMLLENDPALSGESILGLTFTKKAAGEMKWRIERQVGERAKDVWLGTFHSFCEKILLEANPEAHVLDDTDHWILLRKNIRQLELNIFKRLADPGEFLKDFTAFISRCQDELVTPEDYDRYVAKLRAESEAQRGQLDAAARAIQDEALAREDEIARVYRVSERLLQERSYLTFGTQLMRAVQALRSDAAFRGQLRERYRYILVDEFQDTNWAQLELLRLLMNDSRNVFVVGDHNQAVYRFRGASFASLQQFLTRFCGVTLDMPEERWPRIHLTQNYRSTKRILRVAGTVASASDDSRFVPFTPLETENPEGDKIRVVEFGHANEEAEWIANEIERLHTANSRWRDYAALYRKHTHRKELVEALTRREIPYVIKNRSILESTLIRDIFAYLRVIASPFEDVACARILGVPYWRMEARDLVRLAERAKAGKKSSIWEQFELWCAETPGPGKNSRAVELASLMGRMRERATKLNASELLTVLIGELGIAPLPAEIDSYNLARLKEFVEQWQKKKDGWSLHDFIAYMEFFAEADGRIDLEDEPVHEAVQLMTVHGAKGLEFPHVFVLRLSKGDFPLGARKPVFQFPVALMQDKPEGDVHKQEEKRLFYVALTRARRTLTLSTVMGRRKRASEFLDDILGDGKIQKFDIAQTAPKVVAPRLQETVGSVPADASQPSLFGATSGVAKAYSRVALWAKAYHPPRPEPLQLSASAIESYLDCPMKYQFGALWSLRGGPAAEMTFGNVMHNTIKEFVGELRKGRKVSFEDACGIYERLWSSAGFLDDYQEEEYKKEGRESLLAFCRSYLEKPADVLMQEKRFELPMENNVSVTGRIDQVNRVGRGEVEVLDYKTGNPKSQKYADESLQLSLYALAAREVLQLNPERLVLYNVKTNQAVVTSRDEKALRRAWEVVGTTADLIRAGEFGARPGWCCRNCEFLELCPAHEDLVSIRVRSG